MGNISNAENITDSIILNGFKENNIKQYYVPDDFHYSIKNNCTNKQDHIIGRDFRLSYDLVDLVCKIITGDINCYNAWYLLPEDYSITVFSGLVEIEYNKFIIRFDKVEIDEKKIYKLNASILNRSYEKISKDEFISFKKIHPNLKKIF
jgi:hypothetical protein